MTKPKPKRGRPVNPERRQENTRAILNAALDVFTEKGFSEARVSDIAERAGIAKGTVYLYFDSKEALFEGVLTDLIDDPWSQSDGDGPRENERVGDFVRRTLGPIFNDFDDSVRGRVLRLVFFEGNRFPALATSYHRIVITPALKRIQRLAALAVERGESTDDTLQRFPMLVFAPGLLAVTWNHLFTHTRKLDLGKLMQAYMDALFHAP